MSIYFVTGIDTDAGKTYATGILARSLMNHCSVITQKIAQTGNDGISQDIITHRKLMQTPLLPIDTQGLTCPYTFTKPASPHLSARLENTHIDTAVISRCSQELALQFDVVLLEGAGGVLVPIDDELLTLDYIAQCQYPIILVTSAKLGSINHTLLSIEAIRSRGLVLHTLIFNHHFDTDTLISGDTRQLLQKHLAKYSPNTLLLDLPNMNHATQEFIWQLNPADWI